LINILSLSVCGRRFNVSTLKYPTSLPIYEMRMPTAEGIRIEGDKTWHGTPGPKTLVGEGMVQ